MNDSHDFHDIHDILRSQHIWTPDVIIHDLVSFNKPEILNQVIGGHRVKIDQYETGDWIWKQSAQD